MLHYEWCYVASCAGVDSVCRAVLSVGEAVLLTGLLGVSLQILVWCFPLHLRQRFLELHWDTRWCARQLKHNRCCLMISMRAGISLWVSQLIAVWLPLQYTQHNLPSAVLLGCGLQVADVKKEAVDSKLVWQGEDACWPASKILISLWRADWSSWIVHQHIAGF